MGYVRVMLLVCIVVWASGCSKSGHSVSELATTGGSSGGSSSGGSSSGSGGSGTPPPKVYKPYAYVSGSSGLKSYAIDSTALLGAITDVPQFSNLSATVDPLGKYVWVIDSNTNATLYSYSIAPTSGTLALLGSVAIPGKFSYRLAADPTGQFLFSSNNDSQDLTSYKVDRATGLVTVVGSVAASVSTGTFTDIGVHPTGKYIYVAGPNTVSVFAVGATGALTGAGGIGTTGSTLAFVNTGTVLYLYAGDSVYSADAVTGVLTRTSTSTGLGLAAYANGYVYTAGSNQVYCYSIGAEGALMLRSQTTVNNPGSTSALFKHLAVSPDGTTLYVNSDSTGNGNFVHQLSLNATTGAPTDRGVPVQITGTQLNSIWPIRVEQP